MLVWKYQYYSKDLLALGPKYECSRCELPEKDLARDCPRCPLSEAFRLFKSDVAEEIQRRCGGFGQWSFERLLRLMSEVTCMLDGNKGKVDKQWDAFLAECARVIQSERLKARFVEIWNQRQQSK